MSSLGLLRKIILCCVLCLFFESSLPGQKKQYFFKDLLSIDDGLSQSTINCIYQDDKGFVWFGTDAGLNRYDGVKVKTVLPKTEKGYVFGNIRSIVGSEGRLYLATEGSGLCVYDIHEEHFDVFQPDALDSNSIGGTFVSQLEFVDDSVLWCVWREGFSSFNVSTQSFVNYRFSEFDSLEGEEVFGVSLFVESDTSIWIGTYGRGLLHFDTRQEVLNRWEIVKGDSCDYPSNIVRDIVSFSEEQLLVAVENGAFLMNKSDKAFVRLPGVVGPIKDVVCSRDSSFWLASAEGGLFRLSTNLELQRMVHDPLDEKSLSEDYLMSLMIDRVGDLWIGTQNLGVCMLNDKRKQFFHYYHRPLRSSIPGNSVYDFVEDANGDVWIATMKGLSKWVRAEDRFVTIVDRLGFLKNNRVWTLLWENDTQLWVGSTNGIVLLDVESMEVEVFQHIRGDAYSIPANEITELVKDTLGRLWVGTSSGLGCLVDEKNKIFRNYFASVDDPNSLSNNVIWAILSDSCGRLWIGTSLGLNRYCYEKDNFEVFSSVLDDSLTLSNNEICSLLEGKDSDLWITTVNGLNRMDANTGVVQRYGEAFGFSDLYFYNIISDANDLWLSSNKGISRLDIERGEVENYDVLDGLQSNEFNAAAVKLRDGLLLFGGVCGFTGFYPDSINKSSFVPSVYFTELSVNGVTGASSRGGLSINVETKRDVTSVKELSFYHTDKLITIEFAALDYSASKRIKYFYRMLPETKEWVSLENQNFVSFLNLKPGEYELQVRSTNSDLVEVDNMASIKLTVYPPLWRRGWFILLELLSFVILFYLLLKWRFSRLKQEREKLEMMVYERTWKIESQKEEIEIQRDKIVNQNKVLEQFAQKLEEKVRERTRQLEAAKVKAEASDRLKTAFLSNMSHEIRTPMNAIIGFSELLLETSFTEEEKVSFARTIKTNGDTLLDLLNDIIDISIIESGEIKIQKERVSVYGLVEDIVITLQNSPILKEKECLELIWKSEMALTDLVIDSDPIRLKQILTNLISNALKFTNQGVVEVGYEHVDGRLEFFVSDTGIGISFENQSRIFDRFLKVDEDKRNLYRGSGLGLTITRTLVELLGGAITVKSEVGVGSVFEFYLPLH